MAVYENVVTSFPGECSRDVKLVLAFIIVLLIIGLLFRCQTGGRCGYPCRRAFSQGVKIGELCRKSGFRREILFPESGWEGARILGIITLILIKKPGRADMPFPAKTTPTGVEPVSRA